MRTLIEERCRELAKRAGFANVPPAVAVAAAVAVILAVGIGVWRWWPASGGSDATIERLGYGGMVTSAAVAPTAPEAAAFAPTSDAQLKRAWVHVVGAVRHPGLYAVIEGSRVNDAIEAAGGFVANAAQVAVNLARPVADGEQLVVPTEDEVRKGTALGAAPSAATGGSAAGAAAGGAAQAAVDINSATAEQLDGLPGIGPATAAKIVAERTTNGPFASADDLARVAGIGPKKLEQLKGLVRVR